MKQLGKIHFYDIENTNSVIYSFDINIDFQKAYILYSDSVGQLNIQLTLMDLIVIQTSIKNRIEQQLAFSQDTEDSYPGFIKCDESQYVITLYVNNNWRFIQIIGFNKSIFKELIETLKESIINYRFAEINHISGGHQNSPTVQNIKNNVQLNGTQKNYQTGGYNGSNAPNIVSDTNTPETKTKKMDNPKKVLNNSVQRKKDKIKKLLDSDEAKRLINRELI